jgi:uncharacterized protein (TIGR03083 family)
MEIAQHIEVVRTEGRRFAEAARREGLDAAIEPCPGWAMRDLVRHLAEIHLWAAGQVSNRASTLSPDDESVISSWWPELPALYPADADLIDYYLATNANLLRELESAPADLDCPTFLPAPSPLAMWARRQAHETAVHRFDAESPGSEVAPFDPTFAADGVDEILLAFAPRGDSFPVEAAKTMALHASDTGDDWLVTMTPGGISTAKKPAEADATLVGKAADLYLAVWNRGDDSSITVSGDETVLEAWRDGFRIRWSRDRDDDN